MWVRSLLTLFPELRVFLILFSLPKALVSISDEIRSQLTYIDIPTTEITIFKVWEKREAEGLSVCGQAHLQEQVTLYILVHLAVMNSWF